MTTTRVGADRTAIGAPALTAALAEALVQGHRVPAVLALAVECIEAWALADPDAWERVYGSLMQARAGERVAAIVGWMTWQTMPRLPPSERRLDIVITRSLDDVVAPAVCATSFDDALRHSAIHGVDRVCVLGGEKTYRAALGHFRCTDVHHTRVETVLPGADTFWPEPEAATAVPAAWQAASTPTQHHDNGFGYRIEHWTRFAC